MAQTDAEFNLQKVGLSEALSCVSTKRLKHHHAALAPLLGRTEIVEVSETLVSRSGVKCSQVGRLEVSAELFSDPVHNVMLRYGLELAWLRGVTELGAAAAAVLAGRTAGCFASLLGHSPPSGELHHTFAALTARIPDPAALALAAATLSETYDGPADLSPHDLACCEALWPLALPTECLLASGGDDRLTLDPKTGKNRYGCTPWPRDDIIAFSSCTASSLTAEAFEAAERARQLLVQATLQTAPSVALAKASDEISQALLQHFDVADLAEAVLAASGTDATLVVTGLLAAERPGQKVTSILMSPSETGSGVPDAVQGRHFASSAAAGCKVGKGQPIEGLILGPDLVIVGLRTPSGEARSASDVHRDCQRAIRKSAAVGHVVLHAIDGSKTGLTAPDRATCRELSKTYGDALDIVVDACQARIEPALVRWYLKQGFPVLLTGSKFFGAPGFCGAVLFPRSRLQRIARHGRLPAGLAPYARIEGGFGSRRCPGLVLRWCAALHQMANFASLPAYVVRKRLDDIGLAVRTVLRLDDRLSLVGAPRNPGFGWSGRRSVFTFAVRASGRHMSALELRALYQALGADISDLTVGEKGLASTLCQIGQPVELGSPDVGGLRIAVSAAQLDCNFDYQNDLSTVVRKLGLLLDMPSSRWELPKLDENHTITSLQDRRAVLIG